MITRISMVAALALSLTASMAMAGEWRSREKAPNNNYELSMKKPQVRGYYFKPGGHRYDFEYEPFLRRNGPHANFPELDSRSFREKAFGDPRQPEVSASAL